MNKYRKIISFIILFIFLYFPIKIKINLNYEIILDYPQLFLEEYKNVFDLLNKKNNLNLFRKKNKIENIFILIIIFPFIKKEIIITKRNPIFKLYKNIFNIKNNTIIKIEKKCLEQFSHKFKDFIYYKWEALPNRNKTNYLRHILYHY